MFLLGRIDFLALVGLFAQTALTWVLLCVFAALRGEEGRGRSLAAWTAAFAALAVGLTTVSVRFFMGFDVTFTPAHSWDDGQPRVRACYAVYMLGKVLFAHLLLIGACGLADRLLPRPMRVVGPLLALTIAILPWFVASIDALLACQAPVIVGYFCAAWWVLRDVDRAGSSGVRLVRLSLLVTALAWVGHGFAASLRVEGGHGFLNLLLAFNSHIDAALELLLGAGLIVALLQDTHRQLREAQAEQTRLRAEAERDTRLRALGTLVSGVAHELNNPLTAILGFAEDLADPRQAAQAALVVREQAERCRGIVHSLSSLADARPRREPVDGGDLIGRVARGFGPQLRQAGVRLETRLRDAPLIAGDRIGIEQIIANLIANAVQASEPGGLVTVELGLVEGLVEVDVIDDGCGVPDALKSRLFEPFFTTKPVGRGTGLGLAVSFAIARSHGGTLAVADAPGGRGARFRLRLPLFSPAAGQAPQHAVAGHRGASPTLRLLVVDDEPLVRSVLRSYFSRLGYHVVEAQSAEDGLRVVREQRPDVVLCDLRMPGIGGPGFHDEMRRSAPELLARCLFISGDVVAADALAFARRARVDLIAKPFDFDELRGRIERVLQSGAA